MTSSRYPWRRSAEGCHEEVNIVVWSAYRARSQFAEIGMSFIKILKRVGPSTEPCGTAARTGYSFFFFFFFLKRGKMLYAYPGIVFVAGVMWDSPPINRRDTH